MKTLKRQKRNIDVKNKETNEFLTFEITKLTGGCCWKLKDRKRGGQSFHMAIPGIHQPGWAIKSVQLLKNC